MKIEKLKNNDNQLFINHANEIWFQSYDTVIAKKGGEKIILDPMWDYSKTTTRYLLLFLGLCSKRQIQDRINSSEYEIKDLNNEE